MNNYSPNMLKTFDECQHKFFLKYVQKLSLPQRSKIFEKGKKIHALANYYLNGEDISKMEGVLSPEEKAIWQKLKSSRYFDMTPLGTEYNLSCKVGDKWVGGRLDALMRSCPPPQPSPSRGEGEPSHLSPLTYHYIILDYKTGQIPQEAEFDFQTMVYLLCADKFLNLKGGYDTLKFVYIGLKNDSEKEISLSADTKKLYEEKLTKILKDIEFAINTKVFAKNPDKCKTCEYGKLCK